MTDTTRCPDCVAHDRVCCWCHHTPPSFLAELPSFITEIGTGMRRLSDDEEARNDFSPEEKAELLARLDEFDRCRNRGAVEARTAFIGGRSAAHYGPPDSDVAS